MKDVKELKTDGMEKVDKLIIIGLIIIGLLVLVGSGFIIKKKLSSQGNINDSGEIVLQENGEPNYQLENGPVRAIKDFYTNINNKNFASAYQAFELNRLGQEQFKNGFNQVQNIEVEVVETELERIENNNSVFVTLPLIIKAEIIGGKIQEFVGSFTMKKNNNLEDSEWKIYQTNIYEVK